MSRREWRRYLAYEVQRLKQAGASERSIARSLRISRNTVRELLRKLQQRRDEGEAALERTVDPVPAPRASKLDQHEADLGRWLQEFPKLRGTRCLEMLKAQGFDGGYTIVREKLRELRAETQPAQPSVAMSYAPGQRAEFDWSPYKVEDETKVNLWNATLSWSRARCLEASRNTKQTTILDRLRMSFELWKGVPEETLTDSMPGVVDRWENDEPVLNIRFVDFAAHYGFTVLIAPRGCPQWKARTERLYRYFEENCLNGRKVRDFDHFVDLLLWWREHKAMQLPHPETKRPIAEMLEEERRLLRPLPRIPYDTRDVVVAIVSRLGYAHFETNEYPVPAPVGSRVYVCAGRERVEICDTRARRLIEHERLPYGARVRLEQPASVRTRMRLDLDELVARFEGWGDIAHDFAQKVRAQKRYAGPQLIQILSLQVTWSIEDIVASMRHAHDYRSYDASTLERVLEANFSPRSLGQQIARRAARQVEEAMRAHPVLPRDLSSYACLRNGDRKPARTAEVEDGETKADRTAGGCDTGADPGRTEDPSATPRPGASRPPTGGSQSGSDPAGMAVAPS